MCQVRAAIASISQMDPDNHSNVRLILRILFHTIEACLCWFVAGYGGYMMAIITQVELQNQVIKDMVQFAPSFLTNWNFVFLTIFISLSLVYDILEWLDKNESNFGRRLKILRDFLFSSFVFPLTLFVAGMFWIIYWIDRELVFPEVYDEVVPWWFNQCVHTNILVVLVVETILQPRRYPTNLKLELIAVGFIVVLYAVVYYSIYFATRRWLYGVFGIMTWWQVCLFQLLIWAACFVFYFIQFPINRLFHREISDLEHHEKTKSYTIQNIGSSVANGNDLKLRNGKKVGNSTL